jgi:hypothetical protein
MRIECRFCGGEAIDDRDEGLSSHELDCPVRAERWATLSFFFAVVAVVAAVVSVVFAVV